MAKLDQYTPKIMSLVSSKGGAAKMKITTHTEHVARGRNKHNSSFQVEKKLLMGHVRLVDHVLDIIPGHGWCYSDGKK